MRKSMATKVYDLYSTLTWRSRLNVISIFIFGLFTVALIYFGGPLVGVFSLAGLFVGHVSFPRKKGKKWVPNPFDYYYGIFPAREYVRDKEFHQMINKYLGKMAPSDRLSSSILLFYIMFSALTILSWQNASVSLPIIVLGFCTFLFSFIIGVDIGNRWTKTYWRAKDPREISEFFGIPPKEWRTDLKPVSMPPSITSLMWVFYALGVFGFFFAFTLIVGGILGTIIFVPSGTFTTGEAILFGAGTIIPASGCLATGHYLRKMMKEGAMIAVMLCLMAIFVDIISFVVFPLGAGRFPILPYHAIWMLGIPIGVVIIIKRNWRKFKG